MSVETLAREYQKLSPAEKYRFHELIGQHTPQWVNDLTDSITEEEWQAMEKELAGVRNGNIPTQSLQHTIAALNK